MYIVKANATDRDGNLVNVYVSEDSAAPFTLHQRNAQRYESRIVAERLAVPSGFRIVKLVPRSRS